MNKKLLVQLVFVILVVGVGYFAWKNLRGIGPAILPPGPVASVSVSPGPAQNTTGLPLKLPDGFSISTFAKNLSGPRVMIFDLQGNMWVSQTNQGTVSFLEIKDGKVISQNAVFRNLRSPHGLALDPERPNVLYIAEEHRINKALLQSEAPLEKIADLPDGNRLTGGGHTTRTLGFGPDDGRLYVSIGSSCNVCNESDDRRAKIFSLNKDGSDFKEVARGLRNAVFFTWHPRTDELWTTEMGRDLLGDDIPPDEINIVKAGGNYGWPICYGKNIHDTDFDKKTYIRNPCMEPFEQPSHIDLQAHSAPLGLAFIENDSWPSEFQGNLLVAFHGSWNRTVPTGYKVAMIKLNGDKYLATEDFITGWFPANGQGTTAALGRPAGLTFGPDGALYISDDKAGVIYRVEYK